MGSVLEHELADSTALTEAARTVGITFTQARRLLRVLSFERMKRIAAREQGRALQEANRAQRTER